MGSSPKLSRDPATLSGHRILVVEDEYFLADDISRALRSYGAEVAGPVGNLDDVFQILDESRDLDGAVLDVNLRSEMIFPIARLLRSRRVPFVFTTGYDKASIAPEFHDVMLWEKPIDIAAMLRGLSWLVGRGET